MGDMALVVNTELRITGAEKNNRRISGNIVMLPDLNALELLLRKLQVL
jgi:hypothetical protein